MMGVEITLPHNWTPRWYQTDVFKAFQEGKRRAVLLWSRRLGKDDFALHYTATQAMQRVGNYWHMLPQANQCRRAIWEAVNPKTGLRRIDEAFPLAIRAPNGTRQQEMSIKLLNGSMWQLIGSDNYDSLLGSPPIGLAFSEYSRANPYAWAALRPIVRENDGWVMMISTPFGKNHFYSLYNRALDDEEWFASKVTALESGVYTQEQLDKEKEDLIAEYGEEEGTSLFMREYFCSFDAAVSGAYYASILDKLEAADQIRNVPYDPALPVTTAWDLGVGDATAIWFFQHAHTEIRVIDCLEASGEGLAFYVRELQRKPYTYDQHIMPHDIRVRELGTGKSRYEIAQSLGIRPIEVARNLPVDDGINAVRTALPRMWFDKKNCAQGLEALRSYHKKYDDIRKCYKDSPDHDFSSHFCLPAGQLVATTKGQVPIEQIRVGDSVLLPTGETGEVEASGQTGVATELLRITAENGCVLTCTLNHRVLTTFGLASADALGYDESILTQGGQLWRNERWCTTAESIIDGVMDTMRTGLHLRERLRFCIGTFGKMLTDLYQKIVSFITLTATQATTILATSNSCPSLTTPCTTEKTTSGQSLIETYRRFSPSHENSPTLPDDSRRTEQKSPCDGRQTRNSKNGLVPMGLKRRLQKRLPPPPSGIEARQDSRGIANTEERPGKTGNVFRSFAKSAAVRFLLPSRVVRSSATRIVRLERFAVDTVPVYNVTVKGHQCYLAQGLLVSNSDAMRYYCVGYRQPTKQRTATEIMASRHYVGVW